MLLFRSEEHIEAWRGPRGIARGATMTLEQLWDLAQKWYPGRMDLDFKRRTPAEAEAVFESVGLTGDFWRLQG